MHDLYKYNMKYKDQNVKIYTQGLNNLKNHTNNVYVTNIHTLIRMT